MLLDRLDIDAFCTASGWQLRPEGLCRDDICIPLPLDADLATVAERLRMPLVHDAGVGLWALGPPVSEHTLSSTAAPDLELPDVDGRPFALRALRGKKVLLLAWASW